MEEQELKYLLDAIEKTLDPKIKNLIIEMNKMGIITYASCQGHGEGGGDYSSAYVTIDLKAMDNAEVHFSPDGLLSIYWDINKEKKEGKKTKRMPFSKTQKLRAKPVPSFLNPS